MFISGFYSFISYHDYGLLAPEVLLGFLAIFLVGSFVGYLLATAGPTNMRAMGFAILLFIFFDIEFGLIEEINDFVTTQTNRPLRYGVLIISLFLIQMAILGLRKHVASILAAVFATTLLTTLLIPGSKVNFGPQPVAGQASTALDTPPVIHLILDGHIGIEGIPLDIKGGRELRELLIKFYDRWDFRLYGRSYSKYLMTYDSVSNLLNGETSTVGGKMAAVSHQHGKVGWKPVKNEHFRRFSAAGYKIRVYQTEYLDYCQESVDAIEYCYRYSSSSPQLLRSLDITTVEKSELLLGSYFADNSYYRITHKLLGIITSVLPEGIGKLWSRKNYEFSSIGVPAVISKLKSDVLRTPRGRLFFAHLLLPHGPYIWDENCELRDDSDSWLSRRMDHEDLLSLSDHGYRDMAYKYYFMQTVCTVNLLDDLLRALDENNLLEDSTILIHGDHGSRITIADPVSPMADFLTSRDFIDSFSTLFAIRSPAVEPGYVTELSAIQPLFTELFLDGPATADDASVYLLSGPLKHKQPLDIVPIPKF